MTVVHEPTMAATDPGPSGGYHCLAKPTIKKESGYIVGTMKVTCDEVMYRIAVQTVLENSTAGKGYYSAVKECYKATSCTRTKKVLDPSGTQKWWVAAEKQGTNVHVSLSNWANSADCTSGYTGESNLLGCIRTYGYF